MKILITGGAGFIGLNLACELAAQGHHTVLADNFSRGVRDAALAAFLAAGRHSLDSIDLLAPAALDALPDDFDVVCHLAAILGVEKVRREPLAVLRDNVAMNLAVLQFASRQRSLHRFVFASTSEVYAGTLEHFGLQFPTAEPTPLALPSLAERRTSYMLSKIYGEALAHQSGLPFTIFRPHNIYGPRMGLNHVVPQLMHRMWQTAPDGEVTVYSPDHKRTFCYVEDAARMMVAAIATPAAAGATLNVGNSEPEVTMAELARLAAVAMQRDVRIMRGATTPGSPTRRQPDIAAIVSLTGVRPQVGLSEGLSRTFAWYRLNVFDAPSS